MGLADIFRAEVQLATNIVRHPEFAEGVRALLIDKDRNPVWQYPSSRDVPGDVLDGFFTAPWDSNPLADLIANARIPVPAKNSSIAALSESSSGETRNINWRKQCP